MLFYSTLTVSSELATYVSREYSNLSALGKFQCALTIIILGFHTHSESFYTRVTRHHGCWKVSAFEGPRSGLIAVTDLNGIETNAFQRARRALRRDKIRLPGRTGTP